MKKPLPDPQMESKELFALTHGAVKWELLKSALILNLFDGLSDPRTAEEVASAYAMHPPNTEHFLNALTALGFLVKNNGRYCNASATESLLTRGKDTFVGEALLFFESWHRPLQNGVLLNLVRNGPTPMQDLGDENLWKKAARSSLNACRAGRAQAIASRVAALPEFPSFSRMLDLGSGPGMIGIAVAAAHPSLKCWLFDKPAVCRVADEAIAEYGMEDRVATLGGDYLTDGIGEDYDFVIACYTLNFYRDRLEEILAAIHRALRPGGVFMVVSDGLTSDRTAPAATVISWLSTALQGMDMSFEQGKIADAMLQAGFVTTQSHILEEIDIEANGPVELTVGRKASETACLSPSCTCRTTASAILTH
jgi:SAM-dependent methyltransferase